MASTLSDEQTILLRSIARLAKSKTNVFSESALKRKKACKSMDVRGMLHSLAAYELVQPVKKGAWQTMALGRQVAHYLEALWIERKYGFKVERR